MSRTRIAKTPVFLQMEASECGASCLCMLLAYNKTWISLERARIDCGISRDGSNAQKIVKAAGSYGFNAVVKNYSADRLKEVGEFPCMVWWEKRHFVVVNGFKNGKVYLCDPAYGRRNVSFEDFKQSYSETSIYLEPSDNYKPTGKKSNFNVFYEQWLKGNSSGILLIAITALIVSVCQLIVPMFRDVYTSRALEPQDSSALTGVLIAFAIVNIYFIMAGSLNVVVKLRTIGRMAVVSNVRFIDHIVRLPMDFFAQRMSGDLAERQAKIDAVAKTLAGTLLPLILHLGMLIVYVVIMLRYSIILTIIGVVAVLGNVIIYHFTADIRTDYLRVLNRDEAKLGGTTALGFSMMETIKASGAENGFFERWAGNYASYLMNAAKFGRQNRMLAPLPTLIQRITFALILAVGTLLIINGNLENGAFLSFYGVLGGFFNPVELFLRAQEELQEMNSGIERIDDVMNYAKEVERPSISDEELLNAEKLSGEIRIDNVTFGYSRLDEPAIKDFSLEIKRGSRIAIVGKSGSGKSTVAKLIAGLYRPWSGNIYFDGKTYEEIAPEIFTGSLSMVDQDAYIFEDTVCRNIKMWDDTIADYDMILAAKDAGLHDDIIRRKGGYSSRLTEHGKNLSGGQKQKLEIARALASDPAILIMDEATSALDAKSEYEVTKAIEKRGITCVIVAHRLSTIRDCDLIIVISDGSIVEKGTHDELMEHDGYYRRLVTVE